MWLKKSERGKLLHLLLAFYINYIRVRHPKASLHLRLLCSKFRLTFAQFNFAAARYRNPRRQPNGSSNWNPFPNFRLINELRPLTPGSNSKGARSNAPKSGFRVPRWAEPPGMSYSKGIADWRPHRGLRWLQTFLGRNGQLICTTLEPLRLDLCALLKVGATIWFGVCGMCCS